MTLRPNNEEIIKHYIKEELKKEISDERLKDLILQCVEELKSSNTIDAKNLYICSYKDENNDKRIGIFSREDIFHPIRTVNYSYSYNVYTGIDSNYIGIYCISNDPIHNERWLDVGEGFNNGEYVVNCKMDRCLGNFDKFRQIWRKENNISISYDAGATTMEEVTSIRDFINKFKNDFVLENTHNRHQ